MPRQVKTRSYDAGGRRRQAETRRRAILDAALRRFTTDGYAATSMTSIARDAGVALDTVYASVGRKPQLLLAVHDLVLGEGDTDASGHPVPSRQRRYVAQVRAADSGAEKIRLYAEAMARLLPSTAPLLEALREAGATEPECRRVWESVEERRAANMRLFAADLRSTGQLRADLDDAEVGDIVWSMGPAYFMTLRRQGWTPDRYAALLRDVWTRVLLA